MLACTPVAIDENFEPQHLNCHSSRITKHNVQRRSTGLGSNSRWTLCCRGVLAITSNTVTYPFRQLLVERRLQPLQLRALSAS